VDALSLWPLTARTAELDAFSRMWSTGRCRAVLVCGPAGVGKTRLAEEFFGLGARSGVLLGRATASSAAAAVPLGAIAHLIPPDVDMADPVRGFARVAESVSRRGRGRPATLLLDDLHLVDATSAMLLRLLLDAGAVRLIATVRTGESVNEYVSTLLSRDGAHRIDLRAFTVEQAEAVLRAALGGEVARGTVHELHAGSGGNALYLRELVQGGLEDGSLAWNGEIWRRSGGGRPAATPRLVELIETRIAGLEPSGLAVLELLAVCSPVDLADAEAVAGDPAVPAALERAGLIRVSLDQRRTTLLPAHPLYAEVLRARMPVLRARALLSGQAERIQARGARRHDDPLRIAAARLAATGTADPSVLARAAALARHAFDYPRARTLLEAIPGDAHTTATLTMLGEVLFQLGEGDTAVRAFDTADARARGDREILAVALARSFSLFWLAARTNDAFEVCEAARTRMTDPVALRMLRHNEGSMLIASGDPKRGLQVLQDMAAEVEAAPDSTAWLTAATTRAMALGLMGRTSLEIELSERLHAANQKVQDRSLFPHPATQLIQLSLALSRYGDLNRAREVAEGAHTDLVTTASTPLTTVWLSLALGDIESRAGRPTAARRWFAEAAALARAHHFVTPLHPALSGLAMSAAALGDVAAADQAAADAAEHPPLGLYQAFESLLPARLAAARGRLAEARALLTAGADRAAAVGLHTTEGLLLTEVARYGAAAQVAERLASLAEICDGPLAAARARFAAALAADDPTLLEEAGAELEKTGSDLLAAEAASVAAAAYRRSGDARAAAAASRQARTRLDRCGPALTPLLLTSGELNPDLTPRERDVALAASHGESSKEIAASLGLSVRTVENHLHRAYTKLGVTSRRGLAEALGAG